MVTGLGRRGIRGGLLLGVLVALNAQADEAPQVATVAVDFNRPQGKLLHAERFNNFARAAGFAEQRPADVRFYNEQGLHGEIYRVWIADSVYDEKAGTYHYAELLPYLADASAVSDFVLVGFQMVLRLIQNGASPEQIKPIVKTIIGELKQKYPQIKYVEAFNEPDYNLAKVLEPQDLYKYYVPFYQAVNELNAQLHPSVPLQVGGPAFMDLDLPWMRAFLDGFEADRSPDKRLDFISYHGYGHFGAGGGEPGKLQPYHFYKNDPSEVATQRDALDQELRNRGLDANIPSFITEMGIYPGPSFDNPTDPHPDYLRQAAGMASLAYWYMNSPKNVPFNWVVRHRMEERKDQLVTRVPKGEPVPTGVFTPYGNMMLMMSKMKTTRVSAVSDRIKDGKGVYAVASMDSSGITIALWNYQHTNTASFRAEIKLSHLPKEMSNRPIQERMFRIDQKTSNYFSDPGLANLQQVGGRTVTLHDGQTETIELEPNALQLISLEPTGAATGISGRRHGQ